MKKENIAPVTLTDRVLEWAALVLALFMIVLAIVFYMNAPVQVPSHFNAAGEADGWSGKSIYFILLLSIIAGMLICNMAAYNHKMVNLPVKLKPECMPQQLAMVGRMSRILSLLFGCLGIVFMLMTSASQFDMQPSAFTPFLILLLCAFVADTIYYSMKIWSIGKQY